MLGQASTPLASSTSPQILLHAAEKKKKKKKNPKGQGEELNITASWRGMGSGVVVIGASAKVQKKKQARKKGMAN